MKSIYTTGTSSIVRRLSGAILVVAFASNLFAARLDTGTPKAPFTFAQPEVLALLSAPPDLQRANSQNLAGANASIAGFWKFQFVSQGNSSHSPSIPDGALLDFGFIQWHSDGTQIINSGPHADLVLGGWRQIGFAMFELNTFVMQYDANGNISSFVDLRNQVTLSANGNSYTGTLTINVYDPKGNQLDHLTGNVVGTRLTVDSTIPGAIPNL